MSEELYDDDVFRWNLKTIPVFWMDEQTGMMKHIVEKFFEGIHLTNLELKYLKWYIVQWIDGIISTIKTLKSEKEFGDFLKSCVPKDYKKQLDEMDQDQIVEYVENELSEKGIDPF